MLIRKEEILRPARYGWGVTATHTTVPWSLIGPGTSSDSPTEYLIKQYLQTGRKAIIYRDIWEEAIAGIRNNLIVKTQHTKLSVVAELPQGIGGKLCSKMDHLVCFLPGSIALDATGGLTEAEAKRLPTWNERKAQEMELARDLTRTCWGMYAIAEAGLAPEIIWFDIEDQSSGASNGAGARHSSSNPSAWKKDYQVKPADAHNLQRSETVETLFMMWRITRDPVYREWGWKIFQAFQHNTSLANGDGYTSLPSVTKIPHPKLDNMESFWLAETLKYVYLRFSPNDLLPLTEVVFNTEAHVFPVIKQPSFKTR